MYVTDNDMFNFIKIAMF